MMGVWSLWGLLMSAACTVWQHQCGMAEQEQLPACVHEHSCSLASTEQRQPARQLDRCVPAH